MSSKCHFNNIYTLVYFLNRESTVTFEERSPGIVENAIRALAPDTLIHFVSQRARIKADKEDEGHKAAQCVV